MIDGLTRSLISLQLLSVSMMDGSVLTDLDQMKYSDFLQIILSTCLKCSQFFTCRRIFFPGSRWFEQKEVTFVWNPVAVAVSPWRRISFKCLCQGHQSCSFSLRLSLSLPLRSFALFKSMTCCCGLQFSLTLMSFTCTFPSKRFSTMEKCQVPPF